MIVWRHNHGHIGDETKIQNRDNAILVSKYSKEKPNLSLFILIKVKRTNEWANTFSCGPDGPQQLCIWRTLVYIPEIHNGLR